VMVTPTTHESLDMRIAIALTALSSLLWTLQTEAASYRVTRFDDPAPSSCTPLACSLREAVLAANANPGVDRITLAAGTYALTRTDSTPDTAELDRGPLRPTESVQILGAGSDLTRVRWNVAYKFYNEIIQVDAASSGPLALGLTRLTLSHGRGDLGGCIAFPTRDAAVTSQLTLDRVVIEACAAKYSGGAAHLFGTQLNLIQSVLRSNSAGNGGALYLTGPVTVVSQASRIEFNQASMHGGAVYAFAFGNYQPGFSLNWTDDGNSIIGYNQAGLDGGAFAVESAPLHLGTVAEAPVGNRLQLSDNSAGRNGGAVALLGGGHLEGTINQIERVRMLRNTANNGGALSVQIVHRELLLSDSELAGNMAQSNGGAIALFGPQDYVQPRTLRRLGLTGNTALSGGGAIYSECAAYTAENLSLSGNQAGVGRGQAIDALGNVDLIHATSSGQSPGSAAALSKQYHTACANTRIQLANSLVNERCASTLAGQIISTGGNQLGPNAGSCPANASIDQRQQNSAVFGLSLGSFGGAFEVWGWLADASVRPQRNFGLASNCLSADVRGMLRSDGLCDSGAFEQTE